MQNVLFRRNTVVSSVLGSVVLIAALALLQVTVVHTSPSPATTGQWVTLTRQMPINPVHIVLLNTGKVLIVSGSGNVANNADFESALWDPAHPEDPIPTQPLSWDMFCNGIAVLPDGRPIINGGTLFYDPFKGQLRSALYDPATDTFSDAPAMAHGRWYPTVTALGDGRVMTFSGLDENNKTNTTVEIFDPARGWSAAYAAGWTPPLYPRLHLLPSGKVFYSGSGTQSRTFNPATQIWTSVASTNYSGTRNYGTSVLLPLTPANGYKPQVMIMGGGNPATATTEIIDLSQSTPAWQWGPPMSQPRIEMNATILPTGTVLATGGSLNDEDAATASLNADLYDPRSGSFSSAGANTFPRLYHSNALLLPGHSAEHRRRVRVNVELRRRADDPDGQCGRHQFDRVGSSRRAHPRVRHGAAPGRPVVYSRHWCTERGRPAGRQCGAPRVLHAVSRQFGGCAIGGAIHPRDRDEPAANRRDHESVDERHGSGWQLGIVRGQWK
jgi:hypothetical protein